MDESGSTDIPQPRGQVSSHSMFGVTRSHHRAVEDDIQITAPSSSQDAQHGSSSSAPRPEATPTAYVPAGPLPYEDPVDLRLPLHFDGCAEIRELPMDADDPMRIAIKAVDDEFTAMMDLYEEDTQPFAAEIMLALAVTGAARALRPFAPEASPPFINVKISAFTDARLIKEFHPVVDSLVAKHFRSIPGFRAIYRYTHSEATGTTRVTTIQNATGVNAGQPMPRTLLGTGFGVRGDSGVLAARARLGLFAMLR